MNDSNYVPTELGSKITLRMWNAQRLKELKQAKGLRLMWIKKLIMFFKGK